MLVERYKPLILLVRGGVVINIDLASAQKPKPLELQIVKLELPMTGY